MIGNVGYNYISEKYEDLIGQIFENWLWDNDLYLTNFGDQTGMKNSVSKNLKKKIFTCLISHLILRNPL